MIDDGPIVPHNAAKTNKRLSPSNLPHQSISRVVMHCGGTERVDSIFGTRTNAWLGTLTPPSVNLFYSRPWYSPILPSFPHPSPIPHSYQSWTETTNELNPQSSPERRNPASESSKPQDHSTIRKKGASGKRANARPLTLTLVAILHSQHVRKGE